MCIPDNHLAPGQARAEGSIEEEEAGLELLDDVLRRHGAQGREGFVELPLLSCVWVLNFVEILREGGADRTA